MRVLVTGLGTFWGSRVAQRLEQRADVEVVVGVDTREPRLPLERTEFVQADASYSILRRIVRATQVDTILHTHLVVDSTRVARPAVHEINVIGTMNLLAAAAGDGQLGAQGRGEDLDAGLRLELRRPLLLPRDRPAHAAADHAGRAVAARGRGARRATSPTTTRRRGHLAALRQRARRRRRHAVLRACCGCPPCPRSSASTRGSSSCTRTTSPARSCTRPSHDVAGHLQRRRPRHHHLERGVPPGRRGAGWRCRRCSPAARPSPLRLLRDRRHPARGAEPAALRPGRRHRRVRRHRVRVRLHHAGDGRGVRARRAGSSASSARRPPTSTSTTSSTSSGTHPRWCNPRV